MRFVRIHIQGVSRLHDADQNLSDLYEVRWVSHDPSLEGFVLAKTPKEAWSVIEDSFQRAWANRPPPDPMMELVGQDRGVDCEGHLVRVG